METMFGGLLALTVTGLAILAYRHAKGYQLLARPLMLLIGGLGIMLILMDALELRGTTRYLEKTLEEHPQRELEVVAYSISNAWNMMQQISIITLVLLAAELLFLLLWFLPQITGQESKADADVITAAAATAEASERLMAVLDRMEQRENSKAVEPAPKDDKNKS